MSTTANAADHSTNTQNKISLIFEHVVKLFPLSTILIISILIVFKSEHAFAMWNMVCDALDIGSIKLVIVSMSILIVLIFSVTKIISYFEKRNTDKANRKSVFEREKAALMLFFETTGGMSTVVVNTEKASDGSIVTTTTTASGTWLDKTRWGSGEPLSKWKGVYLDPVTKRVNKLILAGNGLTGGWICYIYT